jgi:polysaccharide export outer membrane protein
MAARLLLAALAAIALAWPAPAAAQAQARPNGSPAAPAAAAVLPAGYVIGPEDVLNVVFWREPDLSGEVVVRPDGMISLPLLQDVQAAGLTPEQLADALVKDAGKYLETPSATVTVKEINSRKVFITGQVAKPGPYALTAPMTVLQLISVAGGLNEYADDKNISIMRTENGRPRAFRFNYRDVSKRKNLGQNILLMPGDTVVVP